MNLSKYLINCTSSILDAIKQIENNKKGFIIVVDNNYVMGVLTDGDIRRALINGTELYTELSDITNDNYEFLNEDDNFNSIIEKFKNEKIEFLPILDKSFRLKNILTKNQLHELLLEGKKLALDSDFSRYESSIHSYEIHNRPWGFYKTVFLSEFVQAKIIHIFPKQKLSLQYHEKREEHWVIVKGQGQITIEKSIRNVSSGSYMFIPKGCKHRIENTSEQEPLIISEVQLGTYFGEDDIIRIEDIYNRA